MQEEYTHPDEVEYELPFCLAALLAVINHIARSGSHYGEAAETTGGAQQPTTPLAGVFPGVGSDGAMDLHTISFLFGAVFVAVAILGSGFEVKEIKVPKVGGLARFLSAIVGAVFLVIGIKDFFPNTVTVPNTIVSPGWREPSNSKSDTVPEIAEAGTHFSVDSYLGKDGDAEERETAMRLFIDGKKTAELILSSESPSQSISLVVPESGQHSYMVEGYTVWNITGGRRIPLRGKGIIDVQPGASFTIMADSPPTVTMQEWNVTLTAE